VGQPYIGEIRMFGGNFAPNGWSFCDGSVLAISQNSTLFNLIGTTYGGDGQVTFALPDLRGRLPVHQGTSSIGSPFVIGQLSGVEGVTLTVGQIPSHNHPAMAQSGAGSTTSPIGTTWAGTSTNQYTASNANASMSGTSGTTGLGQPHNNLMPYLCVNFIISLFGIYPSQI